jgi:YqxM protein
VKKLNKLSAGIITATLLSISLIQPVHTTFAASIKNEQAEKGSYQNGSKKTTLQDKSSWDKSSLSFTTENVRCNGISATIKNGQDLQAMQGEVAYEVFWSANGNPKDGEVVYSGVVNALTSGETQELTYTPDQLLDGNYMFKAYQRPGHPGKGVLWSDSLTINNEAELTETNESQRPFDQFFISSVNKGTATFTVPDGIDPIEISFTSYSYPEGTVPQDDGKPYEGQISFDNVTKVYGPGTYTVQVDLPNGYFQTDLYLGSEIEKLTECGHPMDKIIDADYGRNLEPQRPLDQYFKSSVDKGTATFTVPEGTDPIEISFTSYDYPEGTVPQEDGKPYDGQTAYDYVTDVYGPGTYTIKVDLPENGFFQTDLYLGPEIEKLTEAGHPMDKIIDADYGPKPE